MGIKNFLVALLSARVTGKLKDVLCHAHDIAANTIEHIYDDLLTDDELAPAHDIELDKIKDCVLILKTVKELKGNVI